MGLLDVFTGGKSDAASDALRRAESYFGNIATPTAEQLTLPELQKYVEAGVMTPEEAEAYLQERNAFQDMNISQTGTDSQVAALNKLAEISDFGAEGTPAQRAAMENSLSRMNASVAGQRGAIEQAMAAKGIPRSLISAALQNQTVGQEAQQAHMDAVNAQAAAYQTALNALAQQGQVGNALQGQQNTQANTVAQAQNAMQQFNAQNQQQNSQFNAANRQDANMANAANRQQIANNNTGLSNARTEYNAKVPQQVFNNQLAKAQGQAGAATNIGNLYQQQGQQNAGLWGGLINTATSFIPKPGMATGNFMAGTPTGTNNYAAHGGVVKKPKPPVDVGSTRGYYENVDCMAEGGEIPGEANFPGDTEANDTVPIMASPGEAIIPRSSVAENPEIVESLIDGQGQNAVDVQDVVTLLKAMRAMRMGVA